MLWFKENLRLFRKSNKLTQSAFAILLNEQLASMSLDISYNNKSISMWEKGERLPDSPLVWLAIADVIGVSVDRLMREDMSAGEVAEVKAQSLDAEHSFNTVKLSLAEGYMSKVSGGTSGRATVFALYSNLDGMSDDGIAHGMACFVSNIKCDGGYHRHYNMLSNDESMEYIDGLSRRSFVSENAFVEDIIAHGGNEVIATQAQIDDIWRGFFASFSGDTDYNVEVLYDSDCDHILTIVEYELKVGEREVADYISYELNKVLSDGTDSKGVVGKMLVANNKLQIGIRYAREKWRM